MTIWPCPPAFLPWLTGLLAGIGFGLLVGWLLRGWFVKVEPIQDSYFQGGNL